MATVDFPRLTESEHTPTPPRPVPLVERRSWLTVEHLAYIGLALLSLLAHMWALGDRALHHDETLHAAYSWNIYTGQGYIHDPLLHGPFLYYLGALNYFLFTDNDFTARLGVALFGTVLTVLPFLVRRELGRPAALMAAVYLLISPVVLYVGRFIRHDMYAIVFEMLVFVAVVRYASTRRPLWLYVGAAAFGLMVVTLETSYLFSIMVFAPLLLLFLWRVYWPGIPMLGVMAVLVAALIFVLPGKAEVDGAHNAIRDPQTNLMRYTPGPIFGWYPLETYDNAYALRIRNRADNDGGRSLFANLGQYFSDLGRFFGHPAVLLAIAVVFGGLGLLCWLIWGRRDGAGVTPWGRAIARGDPVVAAYASLVEGRRWLVALALFFGIYALFFTAFFTNMLGLITGVTGSLLYWLAQHNVERGGQPDHYYTTILTVYEPLLLFWVLVGMGLLATMCWRVWRLWRAQNAETQRNAEAQRRGDAADGDDAVRSTQYAVQRSAFVAQRSALIFPLVLFWWVFAAWEIYSWAGERMPWLTIHIVLPLVLFGAWAAQQVLTTGALRVEHWLAESPPLVHSSLVIFTSIFTVVVGLGFILMTAYVNYGQQLVVPLWSVPLFALALLGLLVLGTALRWSWGYALAATALCITLIGGLYTFRNAYRLAYLSGDTPREMLIYTQTSPDVMNVVRRLEEASRRRGGNLDMPVIYDNETVWSWYMRDFRRASRTGPQLSGPPAQDVQAVLLLQENLDQFPQNREYLRDFRLQRFPLRWWFPEDQMYRLGNDWTTAPVDQVSLVGRVLREPFAHETLLRVWDYMIWRDTRAPLGSTDFVLAVRPALADEMGLGIGGE
nr:TIGR03663 family protein [Chloroflexaceae bacterium]